MNQWIIYLADLFKTTDLFRYKTHDCVYEWIIYLLNWFIQTYHIQWQNKSVIEYVMQLTYLGTKRKISIRQFLIHNNYLIYNKMSAIKSTWEMMLLQQIWFSANETYLN